MESQQRTIASPQVLAGTAFQTPQHAATVDWLRAQFMSRLKGIVQNASEMLTPTDSLPALNMQSQKNAVIAAAESVINRRWNADELSAVTQNDSDHVRRYDDEVRRLVQKCRNDVERSMSHAELTDLRQEEQHYEERLKIRMKQRMLNIPWPQRGEVMTNYEARIIARIERCHRNPV